MYLGVSFNSFMTWKAHIDFGHEFWGLCFLDRVCVPCILVQPWSTGNKRYKVPE